MAHAVCAPVPQFINHFPRENNEFPEIGISPRTIPLDASGMTVPMAITNPPSDMLYEVLINTNCFPAILL